jgi:spermidine synthase
VNTSLAPAGALRPPVATIALLSGAALGYEILLIRLFSIIQWHHFAYMIISLALLGYGASGTFLTFLQERFLRRYPTALRVNLALFALTALPCFLLAQRIPFNPEQMLWDWRETLRLTAIYLLLSLPFFFAANSIALTLAQFRSVVTRVYAADLLGAGTGSLAVLVLLYLLPPLMGLVAVSAAGLACLPLATLELGLPRMRWVTAAATLLLGAIAWLGAGAPLTLSPYKALSQALRVEGARVVAERYSPLALLTVVQDSVIPPRYAPGMSLNAAVGPPEQLSLFSDGNNLGAITRDAGERQALQFLDELTSALPYHLNVPRRVLVLGAGGGMDVLQATWEGAGDIDAVELNPQVTDLIRDDYAQFSGGLYQRPNVHVYTGEARGFIARRDRDYDLIQLSLQDSPGAASAGLYALSENYLYTTQAMQVFLRHLSPGGYLVISQWIKLPPRDTLKLFATVVDALRADGVTQPGGRLMLIRGWQTSTLLVKNTEISAAEIRALQDFCRARSFDVAWYPGMPASDANRYNRLQEPYFYQGAKALLGADSQAFMAQYKFNLQPATDDRPYFHNFFKWSTLPEILELRGQGGLPLLETGYPVIVATLIQAALLSAVLILLPLGFLRRTQPHPSVKRLRVITYFAAIGLAFLFLEVAFIQKFMRFLHHPVFTAAVMLAAFLVFAGLGSFWARRFSARNRQHQGTRRAIAAIILVGTVYLLSLDGLFDALASWPAPARMLTSSLLVAPLAFFMGAPFPLALGSLGRQAVDMIPLAWGVNGCASVLSAVLATLLAIHFGFAAVVVLALLLYIVAGLAFPAFGD